MTSLCFQNMVHLSRPCLNFFFPFIPSVRTIVTKIVKKYMKTNYRNVETNVSIGRYLNMSKEGVYNDTNVIKMIMSSVSFWSIL